MLDIRPRGNVLQHYPDAFRTRYFIEAFLAFTRVTLGIGEKQIAFLTSICSDDLNSVQLPDTKMVGPFMQGGLDGYPFAGRTGLGAFSHHLPTGGAAMMFFGPHVGVTQTGQVGKVIRPGQTSPSDCCGAAAGALRKLEADQITPKHPSRFAEDDYQQEKLEQLVLKHKAAILGAGPQGGPQRFIRMSEVLNQEERESMTQLLSGVHFEAPAFLFGGILLNEDAPNESSIALRSAGRVDRGKYEDVTEKFKQFAEPKFKELSEGKRDAFR